MRRSRFFLAAAVVLAACGGDSGATTASPSTNPSGSDLDTAEAALTQFVGDTVTAVLGDRPSSLEDGVGRYGCGSETEDVAFAYELSVAVPAEEIRSVTDAVSERWTAAGSDDEQPGDALTFAFDGYVVGLTPFPDEGRVMIGGSTDCFPPE